MLDVVKRFGIAARSFLVDTLCGYEGNDPVVCCPNTENLRQSEPPVTNNNPFSNPQPTNRPNNQPNFYNQLHFNNQPNFNNQQNFNNQPNCNNFRSNNQGSCGYSLKNHDRIVGGAPAELGAWPWMANLGYRSKDGNSRNPRWLCGGSLISDRHILTAAHCVHNRRELFVIRLGEHILNDENDGAHPIDIRIERSFPHPRYNPDSLENDIAILKLEKPVQFTGKILLFLNI